MTGASSLAFPGSRTLAAWRRALAAHLDGDAERRTTLGHDAPRRVGNLANAWWVGYLYVHRIEALTESLAPRRLEPLQTLLLQAIGMERSSSAEPVLCSRLDDRLHLGVPVVRTLLRGLAEEGLIDASEPSHEDNGALQPRGSGESNWRLTPLGESALRDGRVLEPCRRRRVFSFVERVDPVGNRTGPPHFLPLADAHGTPWHPDAEASLSFECLRQCLHQDEEWKRIFGFPADVSGLVPPPTSTETAPSAWDSILLDRGERLCLLLLIEGDRLLGFGVKQEGWSLNERSPILDLPANSRSIVTDVAHDPPKETWRLAWLAWCQTRGVSPVEAEACRLSFEGERLRVEAAPNLIQRLEAAKNDIAKGEAWILAGEGYLRRAARIELAPPSSEG